MVNKLLIGGVAVSFLVMLSPALAQSVPPPGVAQGTVPLFLQPAKHVPPVIRSAGPPVRPVGMYDRIVTREEMLSHVQAMFARIDTNHDGFITRGELAAFRGRMMQAMASREGAQHPMMGARFRRGSGNNGDMASKRAALFDALDTNHDGVISREEFMAARRPLHGGQAMRDDSGNGPTMTFSPDMRMHDMGRDGARTHDASMRHMGARHMGMGRGFGARLFAMADKNHDGRVSLAELEAAALRHFDRIDLNHDGKITPDERRQARERMRAGHSSE